MKKLLTPGERIASRRKDLGLDRKDLAEACDVTVQAIGNWERGDVQNIRLKHLVELLEILGISLDYLLHGESPPNEIGQLNQKDIDFLLARRALEKADRGDILDATWTLINHALIEIAPDIPEGIMNRDLEKQRSAHPRLVSATKSHRNKNKQKQ